MAIRFAVLGPLELRVDGRALRLTSGKQRLLVAVLLVHGGEVVRRDRLVDALWHGRPPPSATGALQNHVSQLRKAIDGAGVPGDHVVRTEGVGYRLVAGADDVDAGRFERLAATGREALRGRRWGDAAGGLREALACWRGPAYAELADAEPVRPEAQRLDTLRLLTIEERVEADVALGRHGELVGELEALAAEHPTRERLWAQLMRCLYRSGRQADALRAYQRLRRHLGEELGLEPSPELARLEGDILVHAPALAWAPPPGPGPPPPPPGATPRSAPERAGGRVPAAFAEPDDSGGDPQVVGGVGFARAGGGPGEGHGDAEGDADGGGDGRRAVDAPGNTTGTVLFTDLVGSTALRASLGEDAADELRRVHDRLLGDAVAGCRGRVVKGGGDGLMAMFGAASDALTAAVRCQQAIDRHNRRSPAVAHLAVRIGLSVGDVRLESGDCFGLPVVEAARLQAAARGGQILCSDLVRVMARGRGGHELRPLGPFALKGLPEPIEACEVVWRPAGTPAEQRPLPPELDLEAGRPFVGREAELQVGSRLLRRPGESRPALLWLAGEPGIGKTRLAAEVAHRARHDGALVLFGRCSEDLGVPYQPFVEALRGHSAGLATPRLAASLGPGAAMLSRLLPELAARAPELRPPPETTPENDRYRLFEAVRGWLATAGGDQPLLVVLDDLHWATRPTLQLLGHVARSTTTAPVVLLCTARDTAPDEGVELSRFLAELPRRAGLTRIDLTGLDEAELTTLLGDDALAARMRRETAGNPLYVEALQAGGSGVAQLARARVGSLTRPAAELLTMAAVAGLDFELAVVARAARVEEAAALDALDEAVAARLLTETATDRYSFTHALVRDALRAGVGASRRARLHAALADAFSAVYAGSREDQVILVAHHRLEAGPAVPAARTVAALREAAGHASRQFAHDEAARLYAQAAQRAEDAAERVGLRLDQATALCRADRFDAALSVLDAAHAEAIEHELGSLAADAATTFEAVSWLPGHPGHRAATLLRSALAHLPATDTPRRAVVTAALGRALRLTGRYREARRQAAAGVELARRSGEAAALARALECQTAVVQLDPTFAASGPAIAEWRDAARRSGDLRGEALAHLYLIGVASWSGDVGSYHRTLDAVRRLVAELRDPFFEILLSVWDVYEAVRRGDLAEADRRSEATNRIGAGGGPWHEPDGAYGVRTFFLRREQDRLREVEPALALLTRLGGDAPLWRPGLVLLHLELGHRELAAAEYEPLAADGFARLPRDGLWLLHLWFLAEVCARLGDGANAHRLEGLLAPYSGLNPTGSGEWLGPADRPLGLLRAVLGDREGAVAALRAAIALCRRFEAPLYEARSLCDLAQVTGERAFAEQAARLAANRFPAIARRAAALQGGAWA